jgi:hypothetical protein
MNHRQRLECSVCACVCVCARACACAREREKCVPLNKKRPFAILPQSMRHGTKGFVKNPRHNRIVWNNNIHYSRNISDEKFLNASPAFSEWGQNFTASDFLLKKEDKFPLLHSVIFEIVLWRLTKEQKQRLLHAEQRNGVHTIILHYSSSDRY